MQEKVNKAKMKHVRGVTTGIDGGTKSEKKKKKRNSFNIHDCVLGLKVGYCHTGERNSPADIKFK